MDFIKKNVFVLACAIVGLSSVGTMLWGMSRMSTVRSEMSQAVSLHGQINNLMKNPTNTQAVDYQEARHEQVLNHYDRIMQHFRERNNREPLMPNLFPEPPKGPDAKKLRYEFLSKYREAMEGLLTTLNATQPPTRQDIDETTDYLKRKAMEAAQFGAGASDTPTPPGAAPTPGASSEAPSVQEGPEGVLAYWTDLEERAKNDPRLLTSIDKARNGYCYANLERGGSFDLHPIFEQQGDLAPGMREIWQAQLLYWIEKDVVDALAGVNNAVAARVKEPWVGRLPVKDLLSLRVSDYIYQDSEGLRNESIELPPTDPTRTWTGRFANKLFDVLNVRLWVVVDVRDLPLIMDALCAERYYTLLNLEYEAIKPTLVPGDKVYGSEPAVLATIDLQTYLFWKSFVPLMPPVIREEQGVEAQYEQLLKDEQEPAAPGEEPAEDQG